MQVTQSAKLANVCYDIRGPVLHQAKQMEAEGHRILKLNIGNPAPFGFEAPEEILQDVILNLHTAHGYGDSKGLLTARRAVVQYYQQRGLYGVDIEDVYLGNGVSELIVMAMQALLYDDVVHVPTATLAPDLLCLTLNGLSKAYRVAGFRTGWMVVSGAKQQAESYIEGLDVLANMRLCPNMPTQYAVQTALGGHQSINDLVLPGGRLVEQRDRAWELLTAIPGVTCVKPTGALYAFPRLDPEVYPIVDDERFV